MRLSLPCTTKDRAVPFEVSVGDEGVDPLSRAHPEKLSSVKFSELNHRLAPSIPRTTTYSVLETKVAAGLSIVAPVGRLFQLFQEAEEEL
jgi:mRNA-degrading endonuclease toxin of MazEF toxin-antitoxin module